MKEGPSHWSERAKADLPPLHSPGPGPSKRPSRKALFGDNPSKVLAIAAACVICLGIVGGGLAWYFTAGTGGSNDNGGPTTTSSDPSVTTTHPTETTTSTSVSASTSEGATPTTTLPGGSTTTLPGGSTATTQTGGTSGTATTVPPGWMTFQDTRLALSFVYPEHWVQFPLEQASELTGPPTLGLAVADPQGADFGGTPADYVFFGAYEDPTMSAPPAAQALEEWAMMTEAEWPEPLTTIKDLTAFRVNGLDAAAKLYSTAVQGDTLYLRVCFVSAGTSMYIFVFRSEEGHWSTNQPLFDSVLNSFTVIVDQ